MPIAFGMDYLLLLQRSIPGVSFSPLLFICSLLQDLTLVLFFLHALSLDKIIPVPQFNSLFFFGGFPILYTTSELKMPRLLTEGCASSDACLIDQTS